MLDGHKDNEDAGDCAAMSAADGGDPRGYCTKLRLKSGRYNTWGGAEDGWGVPTREGGR